MQEYKDPTHISPEILHLVKLSLGLARDMDIALEQPDCPDPEKVDWLSKLNWGEVMPPINLNLMGRHP